MVTPYLNFNNNASEAISFYEEIFGGTNKKVMLYKDAPPNPEFNLPDEMIDLIMHAEMDIENTKFHFSDTFQNTTVGDMISFAVTVASAERVIELTNRLKVGGTVIVEAEPAFFSPMYGWVKDKYGIGWQLMSQ